MRAISNRVGFAVMAVVALSASGSVFAQQSEQTDPNIVVNGMMPADMATMPPGPEVKGIISARNGNRMQVPPPMARG